jgi:hypothetical protein
MLRAYARAGKISFVTGWNPNYRARPWYRAVELRDLIQRYVHKAHQTHNPIPIQQALCYDLDAITKPEAARFLGAEISDIDYLVAIGRLGEWANRPGLVFGEVVRLWRILTKLAAAGKLENRKTLKETKKKTSRNLWISRSALTKLLEELTIVAPDGRRALSSAARMEKLALARYAVGELVTKQDAAFMLGLSIRGIEHLMETSKLVPIRLIKNHKQTLFRRRRVIALARRRAMERRPRRSPRGAQLAPRRKKIARAA